jgi:hypothetical protein
VFVIVGGRNDFSSGSGLTVTDTRTNTWTVDVGPFNTFNDLSFIASTRQDVAQLQTADQIRLIFATIPDTVCVLIEEFAGVLTSSPLDVKANNAPGGAVTSGNTGTTAATSSGQELAIGAITIGTATGTVTGDATFSSFTTSQIDGVSTDKRLWSQYKIFDAPAAQVMSITWTVAEGYQGVIATYKGEVSRPFAPHRMPLGV